MTETINQIVTSATSAIGVPETVAMLLGGALFGAFVVWLSPAVRDGATSIGYVVTIFAMMGLIFFISRGAALLFDHSNLWPRNIGFSVLWVIYCLSMGVGLVLRRRLT